jgi:hypothetical protein
MNNIYERYFFIKHKIEVEEFRFWDAQRNGCSLACIIEIEQELKKLQMEFDYLKSLRTQKVA